MRVGSVFAGIGGFDLAFERAGAEVIWNCEIDGKCRQVLRKHWPGKPRFKDVKTVTGAGLRAAGLRPDCLVGGFPCQDLSVAGARAGLAGERSGLFFEFARLLEETRPQWFVLENVPGLLSSAGGRDMGVLVSTLVNLGYGLAWRVLDAQYFGVAQRRRRVFIVGCAGDAARAREVLLVGEGGGGDPPARRPTGKAAPAGPGASLVAGSGEVVTSLSRSFGAGGPDAAHAQAGWLVPAVSHALCAPSTGGSHNDHNGETLLPVAVEPRELPATTKMHNSKSNQAGKWYEGYSPSFQHNSPPPVVAYGFYSTGGTHGVSAVEEGTPALKVGSGLGIPAPPAVAYRKATTSHGPDNDWERWEEAAHSNTLDAGSNVTRNAHAVVLPAAYSISPETGQGADLRAVEIDVAPGLNANSEVRSTDRGTRVVTPQLAVRRLTPLECLRLQGFPDGWLDGLGLADSVKYRQIGNAVAVPVAEWIALRLLKNHINGA